MKIIITNKGVVSEANFSMEIFHSDRSVYEVIRVMNGIGIFVEDHFIRLQHSMKSQHDSFRLDLEEFRQRIEELVARNEIRDGNLKFVHSISESEMKWAFYMIPHNYPSSKDYRDGVSVDLLFAERTNPNAKLIQNEVRLKADQLMADQNLYEVLLVDGEGQITEGSRSNVFFVRDEVFYTAPVSKVLVGITRQKVLECLKELGFQLIEKSVGTDEISRFDGVFLCGTSPKVLPVNCIGAQQFETQLPCVQKLMDAYDDRIAQYIGKTSGRNS